MATEKTPFATHLLVMLQTRPRCTFGLPPFLVLRNQNIADPSA